MTRMDLAILLVGAMVVVLVGIVLSHEATSH